MTESLTSAQMRAIERAAIGSGAVSGAELMERAGAAVVAAVRARRPQPGRALVLCGPGNNGGDGFVIARLLAAGGWQVALRLWGDPAALPPDARAMHDAWAARGPVGRIDLPGPGGAAPDRPPDWPPELIVDALFGTGLSRPLPPALAAWLETLARSLPERPGGPLIVAVDVPSGLDADTGAAPGPVLPAGLTVTFHAEKPGHRLGRGPELCGELIVADIGLGPWDRHRHDA